MAEIKKTESGVIEIGYTPSMFGEPLRLCLAAAAIIGVLYLLGVLPYYGIHFKILKFKFKISAVFIKKVLLWALGISSCALAYIILLIKTTRVQINPIIVKLDRGIVIRTTDALDLVHVRDFEVKRSLVDMFFGVRKIILMSKDITHPTLILRGVPVEVADEIFNFISMQSTENIVAWRKARDYQRDKHRLEKGAEPTDETPFNANAGMPGIDDSDDK